MLFALDICVNKNAPPTYSVDWGLNPPPPPHLKNITPSFDKSHLKSANYPKPPFRRSTTPKKNNLFKYPSPPPKKNQTGFSVKSYNINIFHP